MKFHISCLFVFYVSILLSIAQHGALDQSFNVTDIGFGFGDGANGIRYSMSQQSDGKIIICGSYFYNTNLSPFLARIDTNGSMDTTFKVGTGTSGGTSVVYTTSVQSDGKIIIGGDFADYNGTPRYRLARINTDGTIDTGFNPGGGASNYIWTTKIQNDGKILIGGDFSIYDGTWVYRVARINTDGSIDTSFNPGSGANGIVYSIAIQSDGKLIVGGVFSTFDGISRNGIVRLNIDGSVDTGFDPGTGAIGGIMATSIQNDGRIIIGGSFTSFDGTVINSVARLNTDGSLDTTFDIGAGPGPGGAIWTTAVLDSGKIFIGGSFTSFDGIMQNRLARLNTDGSLDSTLNSGGGINGPSSSTTVYSSIVQNDGKIVLGGLFTSYDGTTKRSIARINPDGSIDYEFNKGTGASGLEGAEVKVTVIEPNGKTVIAGNFTYFNGERQNHITRLNTDGNRDTTFNIGTGTNDVINAVVRQNDGRFVLGGTFTSYDGVAINYLARVNTDGSLDTTYYTGSGPNSLINSMAIQSDGKILINGTFNMYDGAVVSTLIRLDTNGDLDLTFNPGSGLGGSGNVFTMMEQSNGKIMIGGDFTTYNGSARKSIARINSDGSLDFSFNPGTGPTGFVNTVSIQSDGKVIAGGTFLIYNGTTVNHIARLNTNGSLDTSFNTGTGCDNGVSSSNIQSDGKILIGGVFLSYNGTSRKGIARLDSNGSVDSIFNPGAGIYSGVSTGTKVGSISIQSDKRIIIGGNFISYNNIGRNRIARLLTCQSGSITSMNICSGDSILLNGIYQTTTGIYYDTLSNVSGCDSVVTLNLTVNNTSTSTLNETACSSYNFGGNTLTSSGTYYDTLSNVLGCDSVVALNLTVNSAGGSTMIETACTSYNFGGNTLTSSGTYYDTLTNVLGCDSVVTLNLTVNSTSTSTLTATACDSYDFGGNTLTSSGTYYDTLSNVSGCDSVVTLNLTIITVDASVNQNGIILSANTNGAVYQWLDCDNNYAEITGETNQSFTPLSNGNYALEVTQNNCADTSSCYAITLIGVLENNFNNEILLFPNPTNGNITIDLGQTYSEIDFIITDVNGKVVQSTVSNDTRLVNMKLNVSTGIYFVTIKSDNRQAIIRVIKE